MTTEPEIPVVSAKLNQFSEKKDEYQAIFIGSSRIYRHIVPSQFDRLMASQGYPIQSYNFGVSGMTVPETHFVLQQILAMTPQNLEFVFLELYDVNLLIDDQNLRTERVIYWHTWEHTLWIYQLLWLNVLNEKRNIVLNLKKIYSHTLPLLYNLTNLGQGDRWIRRILPPTEGVDTTLNPRGDTAYGTPGIDGYLALDDEPGPNFQKRHQEFLENLDTYHEKVQSITPTPERRAAPTSDQLKAIEDLIKTVRDSGATPVFIITPVLEKETHLIAAHTRGYIPLLFAFNDPIEFPTLYDENKRFDLDHLNHGGATEFSKLLAERFSNYLDGEKN
ncbi:hypothetical protein [Lyngbya sp. CCY1209]|uniref:hypothetical protein n=1 Tax=Lyngbya sp. CCY1209 TaxID=2886103 RepID=UPI002D206C91|nr:hypothetical protein [Lyngbya sp. CCY1209]MEB3883316.1 hypothetical protein [Lyngbya sp. CCY1209]